LNRRKGERENSFANQEKTPHLQISYPTDRRLAISQLLVLNRRIGDQEKFFFENPKEASLTPGVLRKDRRLSLTDVQAGACLQTGGMGKQEGFLNTKKKPP
jgi:hypothetical protein